MPRRPPANAEVARWVELALSAAMDPAATSWLQHVAGVAATEGSGQWRSLCPVPPEAAERYPDRVAVHRIVVPIDAMPTWEGFQQWWNHESWLSEDCNQPWMSW